MLKTITLRPFQKEVIRTSSQKVVSRGYEQQRTRLFNIGNIINRNRGYVKKELLGYSMQEMYSVVSDVKNYQHFVPYVKKSHVHSEHSNGFKADLIVGFPPLHEVYTSNVTLITPTVVTSECKDGRLFDYLLNEWRFSPGLKDIPQSCVLDFKVTFQFKSLLHSNIANLFFDLICEQMEQAFVTEVRKRYGDASIKSHILSSRRS